DVWGAESPEFSQNQHKGATRLRTYMGVKKFDSEWRFRNERF
ncbi:MAG: hypothetical protein K0Q46_6369, partial [Rhodococcus erythropolis]|nr:hypothetical protein [Rhodococcus erythropolis]